MNDKTASTPTTETTVTTTLPHPVPWCDPRMCQAGEPGYEDRLHVLHGEDVEMSMCDLDPRDTRADGTQCPAVVAVFVRQHVSEAGPTLGMWSEGGGRARDGFEIKLTRAEFVALHAEMGRAIEATA